MPKKKQGLINSEKKDNNSSQTFDSEHAFVIDNLNVFYGQKQALENISIKIPKNTITAIIGPSGCGKSTFIKTLNRINEVISPSFKTEGKVLLDGKIDIFDKNQINVSELRTKVGMVFQQPNPFPMSIFQNVIYGPKINGVKDRKILNSIARNSLEQAALWNDVSTRLNDLALGLSGGQQQRLCIARTIANNPEVILMDEPTSALDPISTNKIENLILKLKKNYTIIIVTHSMQQAARVSDQTAFFYEGKLIEFSRTNHLFSQPKNKLTDDYIRGRFG